jgi:tetrahydromethanopterin S-methyltransferase subunit F
MNRAMDRSREGGLQWGPIALGWVVAVVAGIIIGFIVGGLYNLVAAEPVQRAEPGGASFILSLITGFLAYLIGGYVAGRMVRASGGLNGAMTAVFGLIVGIVVAIILVLLSLLFTGGEMPRAPVGLGAAGGYFLGGLILFLINLVGGYLGGELGERS